MTAPTCLFVLLCSCSDAERVRKTLEETFSDPPPPAPFTIDFLCDQSASCTPENLKEEVGRALPDISHRAGSWLRVFDLGNQNTHAKLIYETESTPPRTPASPVVKSHHEGFRQATLNGIKTAMANRWGGKHIQSRLVEGLSAIGQHPVRGKRIVIIIGDMQEESVFGHFGCTSLMPTTAAWKASTKPLLAPLAGSIVVAAYASPLALGPGVTCETSALRFTRIKELWQSSFAETDITFFIFATGIKTPLAEILKENK